MATRREKVVLSLEDNFTPGMARAAAATAMLNRELNSLSGTSIQSARASQTFERDVNRVSVVATKADKSINQLTGRLRLFADAAAVLGPALVPLGGVAVAGVAGLTAQMGAAAVAGGVLVGSMQGLGDALTALHKAQLEPTVDNLNAVDEALGRLSPAAANFAREAYDLLPALQSIRDAGAEGLFPGLTESLDNLERRIPVVTRIFEGVGAALGEIASDSTASLASGRWGEFFRFIEDEAPTAIAELASTVGSLAHGMAELWMAFDPVNQDFASWLDGVAEGFDNWASGLAETQGFRDFVDYLRETGPQVSETVGALANALVQIVQAAAPLGGPVLAGIEAVADVLAAIANSSAGPVLFSAAAGLALVSRALNGFQAVKGSQLVATLSGVSANADGAARGMTGFNKAMLGLAGITVAFVALDELNKKLDETLPGLEALKGQLIDLANVPEGFTAAGLSGEFDSLAESIERISSPDVTDGVQGVFDAIAPGDNRAKSLREATAEIKALDDGLTSLVASGSADVAERSLANLADQYGLSATQVDKLMGMLPGYTEALQAEANNADLAAGATERLGGAMGGAEAKTLTFRQALARLNDVLDGRADMRDYEAALDDFTDAMKRNGRNFDITTAKGRENQAMLDGIVGSTLAVAEGMRGTARQKFLTSAIADLRDMGERFNIPKSQIRILIEMLRDANDTRVNPTIDANTAPAISSINAVESMLNALDGKTATTFVQTKRLPGDSPGFGPQPTGSAGGGTVPKTGLPYADRHLYLLADGEEVISNRHGQADRHRSLLKAINGGLADGGTARRRNRRKTSLEFDHVVSSGGQSEQAQAQAADAEAAREAERERAEREAAERAEHESKMFLAAIEGQERAAQGLIDAAETQKRSAEQVRDGWAQAMERAGSAATSGFQSSLFGSQQRGMWSGPGGSSGSSWRDALSGDIKGLQERGNLVQLLAAQGVTGSALEALLAQGSNAQVSELINSGQAGEFAAMFAQREALTASVGGQVGQAAYGREFAAASAAVAALGSQILALQAELAAITAQRPITVYEAYSAKATAAEMARLQAIYGAA